MKINKMATGKIWRKLHPKYRNGRRKANYWRGRPKLVKTKRRPSGVLHNPWTAGEEYMVLVHKRPDRELAVLFGRSVQAIQQRRHLLNRMEP